MKKIITVVGARPQFIKMAVISRELRKYYKEILVHTGQHYDHNMSQVFFEELAIPSPDYNLGISGGSHAQMTANMMIELEKVFEKEQPDCVLLFGDTNSTLAAALVAVKLLIPVAHVESGNRFGTFSSPEEVNRIVTDHISTILFSCTQSALNSLISENLGNKSYLVGDPMYDAFLFYQNGADENSEKFLTSLNGKEIAIPENFYYLTCHRQENTEKIETLLEILSAMEELEFPTIYPVHPRNKNRVLELQKEQYFSNIIFCEPVSYLTSIKLTTHAKKIVTDSGGLQREAFFAQTPCVTVLDFVAWPETMINNCNQLAKPLKKDILEKLTAKVHFDKNEKPFGDGQSAKKIVALLKNYLN